jgi:vanillate O-demethylase monooxygenase subunit
MTKSAVKEAPLREGALWPALREYWHAVAWSEEVTGDKIFSFTLLDEEIVVCRPGGKLAAFSDLCVHRGTPISLGTIEGDKVVCCYHGWEYNAEGKCTRIPSLPSKHPIPKKACLKTYQARDRYGLVWVCMSDTPRAPIPECPLFEDPDYREVFRNRWIWKASAARSTENFFDQGHFAFVHEGILGSRDKPEVSDATIERDGEALNFWVDVPADKTHAVPYVRNYRVFRPFTIYQKKEVPDGGIESYMNICTPNSADRTTRFMMIVRNFNPEEGEAKSIENFSNLVTEQDRVIVERQRPEELPLDLSEELHLKGPDGIAIAYRRFLKELGVEG